MLRDRTESNVKYEPATDEDAAQVQGSCGTRTKNWFLQFPKATWPILLTEFGERFSYYGIKTVLVLFLTQELMFNKDKGKAVYHAFSMVSYFTGVLGAMLADSLLGKYRTIAYTLFFYSLSEVVLTVTSAESVGHRSEIGPLIGLFVMAVACGNIKPCLAAFGGDQFSAKKEHLLELFFAMFYASVNVGAVLCMYFVPMIRTDVRCFGRDCYPVVFAVNTVMIIVAFLAFIAGKRTYTLKPPAGNVMVKVCKIIGHALSNKITGNGPEHTEHWLDNALDKYEKKDVNDIKMLVRVLKMYIPLPVFWALFHQQGSSWTLQAEQMDGDLGSAGTLRSDQIQALNPILVLILIPLYDGVIYPIFERCRLPLSPLKKMTGGLILSAVAFIVCAFVQIQIQTVGQGPVAPVGRTSVEFINIAPCAVTVNPRSFFAVKLKYGEKSEMIEGQSGLRSFELKASGKGCETVVAKTISMVLDGSQVYSIMIGVSKNELKTKEIKFDMPGVDINKAETRVRVLYGAGETWNSNASVLLESSIDPNKDPISIKASLDSKDFTLVPTGEYYIKTIDDLITKKKASATDPKKKYKFGNFGGYTIVILPESGGAGTGNKFDVAMYEDAPGTTVSRLMQVPQYVIITAAEVMFSVTGLGFAYSQAPASMKSVLQSFWLLTVAFGDLIVVILSSSKPVEGVEKEMFLYSGLMGVIAIIFGVMSYFYVYVTPADSKENILDENEDKVDTNGIPLEERSGEESKF